MVYRRHFHQRSDHYRLFLNKALLRFPNFVACLVATTHRDGTRTSTIILITLVLSWHGVGQTTATPKQPHLFHRTCTYRHSRRRFSRVQFPPGVPCHTKHSPCEIDNCDAEMDHAAPKYSSSSLGVSARVIVELRCCCLPYCRSGVTPDDLIPDVG